jgi:hypothetical protein
VGSIGVGYDEATDRVMLVIEEVREQEEPETEEPETEESEREAEPEVHAEVEPESESEEDEEAAADESDRASGRVRLTRLQVAGFVERARGLVESGRPTCRLCGRPMNPGGHRCARTNGHGSD